VQRSAATRTWRNTDSGATAARIVIVVEIFIF
jgi:hypothetical protein